ncbi:TetR/AcrR family transcriptional regulator [Deinococcus sp. 6YEL10]|uniref:TetR/AcrR family transcriptional regulator n=2 Tax=unclassified Deinococcus TaxID=2623546 RepID=UPI001E337D9E|nr:TetR/AcrR family transcriptional regulator [Deinococcus sp. 6YEL10]MCD0163862.1 TetR/AcrR family transcriptional regulator [Deinococcus sp. 6YEL10]
MVFNVRARSEEAKRERRQQILAAALTLWQTHRYPDLTLSAIAAGVGVTKAALFAYFPSKEDLFLSLYETLLGDWFDALDRHLHLGGTHTPASLARTVAALTLERPDLTRLIPLLASILEHNISAERAHAHKTWIAVHLARTAPLLETALPDLPPGGGARLLTYTQALIAGLQPMSDPSPAVRAALDDTDLAALHLRLDGVLPDALHALITGLTVPPDRNVQNESRRR